jgi:hypothetical protein
MVDQAVLIMKRQAVVQKKMKKKYSFLLLFSKETLSTMDLDVGILSLTNMVALFD